jgi:hypothetical protein
MDMHIEGKQGYGSREGAGRDDSRRSRKIILSSFPTRNHVDPAAAIGVEARCRGWLADRSAGLLL